MAFSFGAWVAGYSLTKLTGFALGKLDSDSFLDDLTEVVNKWAYNLPQDLIVNPSAIFPIEDTLSENCNKSLEILKSALLENKLPSYELWFNTLSEQWFIIKMRYQDGAAPFFLINEDDANKYLSDLAIKLYNTCVEKPEIFQQKVINELELAKEMLEALTIKVQELSATKTKSIIESKVNSIEIINNYLKIFNSFFPPRPVFTKALSDYNKIIKITEEIILNIHTSYEFIKPFAIKENILDIVLSSKRNFIDSINQYLLCVDTFFNYEIEEVIKLLDSPGDDVPTTVFNWSLLLNIYKEKLKIELEKEE